MQKSDVNPYKKSMTNRESENIVAFETKNVEFKQLLKPKYEEDESYLIDISDNKKSRAESNRRQSLFRTFQVKDPRQKDRSSSQKRNQIKNRAKSSSKINIEKFNKTSEKMVQKDPKEMIKKIKDGQKKTRDESSSEDKINSNSKNSKILKVDTSSKILNLKNEDIIKRGGSENIFIKTKTQANSRRDAQTTPVSPTSRQIISQNVPSFDIKDKKSSKVISNNVIKLDSNYNGATVIENPFENNALRVQSQVQKKENNNNESKKKKDFDEMTQLSKFNIYICII